MRLHFLEKKYGIRINLFDWSGDDYETGTLNALIKIDRSDVGRILLESIAYHVKHNPGNLAHGILEIRPYAFGDCNGSTDPDLTNKRGQQLEPVVHFWPKAFARGGACSKYLEDHRDEIGGILPDKSSFNPIAAFYQDSMQAWIYANSQAAETRDALGPEAWDRYQEMRKYSETNILRSGLSPEENFKKWLGRKK
jgi:hypothetical protein